MTAPLSDEARDALAVVPIVKGLMDLVKAKLPDGTHFGIMILVPGKPVDTVVAVTTNRAVVAPAVAQWCLEALRNLPASP